MQLVFFVKQEPHCALVLEVVAITCHNGTRLTAPVRSSSPTKERLPAGSTGGCIAWGSTKKAPVTRKRKKLKKSRVLRNRKYERTPVPKRPLTLFSGTCHSWRECRKDSQLYQLCLAPWGEGGGKLIHVLHNVTHKAAVQSGQSVNTCLLSLTSVTCSGSDYTEHSCVKSGETGTVTTLLCPVVRTKHNKWNTNRNCGNVPTDYRERLPGPQ